MSPSLPEQDSERTDVATAANGVDSIGTPVTSSPEASAAVPSQASPSSQESEPENPAAQVLPAPLDLEENDCEHSAGAHSEAIGYANEPVPLAAHASHQALETQLDASLGVSASAAAEESPSERSELERYLEAFHRHINIRKADFEKEIGGDLSVRRLFDALVLRIRELGKVCLRGSEKRLVLANNLLCPELELRSAPQYTIQFEPDDGKEIVYLKRLLSGWCVKVDRNTFEKLAYGGDGLPAKAYENLHMLVARGPVFKAGIVPPAVRVTLLVACDDGEHVARNIASQDKKQEAEQRARAFGAAAFTREPPEAAIADVALSDFDLFFTDVASPTSRRKSTTIINCSEMSAEDCISRVLEAASYNLDRLAEAFDLALTRAALIEKIEYWGALRSSDANSQKLLTSLFDACLGGGTARPVGFECARELCENYQKDYPKLSQDELAQKLVQWQASLNVSTGFVTGFGGFVTMAITIPAGMLATWCTSARLAFAVAHSYGHDIFHPCVADAVLWCLTGSAQAEGDRTPEETLRLRLEACKKNRFYTHESTDDADAEDACLEMEICAAAPSDPDNSSQEMVNYDPTSKEFQAEYKTLYDLLGVPQTATQQEIRLAYRRLALKQHPDKLRTSDPEQIRIATQRFQILGAAYEELGDPARRKAYDASLQKGTWTWASFSWDSGMERARQAFAAARARAAQAFSTSRTHDLSGQVATRAATQAAVELVELSSVGALARAGTSAELRSSIIAGEKLAASATARSSSKLIPIIGALISGAIDGATTASVGRCAVRIFKA